LQYQPENANGDIYSPEKEREFFKTEFEFKSRDGNPKFNSILANIFTAFAVLKFNNVPSLRRN